MIVPEQGFTLPAPPSCAATATPRRTALRRAGARHRHLRGRACAGDPDADPKKAKNNARDRRRQAAGRRHRQGQHPGDHREIAPAGGTGYVLEYAGDANPRAVDGRPHDGLQHVDLRRRPRRLIAPDQQAYDFLKAVRWRRRRAVGRGAALLETLRSDEGAHFDHEIRLDAAALPPIVTWGTSPEDESPVTAACRTRPTSPTRPSGSPRSGRWPIWA